MISKLRSKVLYSLLLFATLFSCKKELYDGYTKKPVAKGISYERLSPTSKIPDEVANHFITIFGTGDDTRISSYAIINDGGCAYPGKLPDEEVGALDFSAHFILTNTMVYKASDGSEVYTVPVNLAYSDLDNPMISDEKYPYMAFGSYTMIKKPDGAITGYLFIFLPNPKWISSNLQNLSLGNYSGSLIVISGFDVKKTDVYYEFQKYELENGSYLVGFSTEYRGDGSSYIKNVPFTRRITINSNRYNKYTGNATRALGSVSYSRDANTTGTCNNEEEPCLCPSYRRVHPFECHNCFEGGEKWQIDLDPVTVTASIGGGTLSVVFSSPGYFSIQRFDVPYG